MVILKGRKNVERGCHGKCNDYVGYTDAIFSVKCEMT